MTWATTTCSNPGSGSTPATTTPQLSFDVTDVTATRRYVILDPQAPLDDSCNIVSTPFLVDYGFSVDGLQTSIVSGIGIPDPDSGQITVRLDATAGSSHVDLHYAADEYAGATAFVPTGGASTGFDYADADSSEQQAVATVLAC